MAVALTIVTPQVTCMVSIVRVVWWDITMAVALTIVTQAWLSQALMMLAG